jgi:hypothetical protein
MLLVVSGEGLEDVDLVAGGPDAMKCVQAFAAR